MKTRNKFVLLCLTFVLLTLSVIAIPSIFAASNIFKDVPPTHWAHDVITRWSGDGYGVIQGDGAGLFSPSRSISLGELAVILSKVFGYTERVTTDVTPTWAAEFVEKAIAAGIIYHADSIDANVMVTREQAIRYIAMAYGISPIEGNTIFSDDAEIGAMYRPYVNAFQQLGYVVGTGSNNFAPSEFFTRAQAMQIMENVTGDILDASVSGQEYINSLVVRRSGLTVQNTIVGKNLIIGQGAGDGKVTLDNVTINGTLVVNGGRVAIDNSTINKLKVVGDDAMITINEGSTVENVTVTANNVVIDGDGIVANVTPVPTPSPNPKSTSTTPMPEPNEDFMLTISVEETTLPKGENFTVNVELKNTSGENLEITHSFLFWPDIPNWSIREDWGGIAIDPPEPRARFMETNSVLRNISVWGEECGAWLVGHTLMPGAHELRFRATFRLQGSAQQIEVWSNTIMITVQ